MVATMFCKVRMMLLKLQGCGVEEVAADILANTY
jgi:hypothetical protein